jgi:hypothetical protein
MQRAAFRKSQDKLDSYMQSLETPGARFSVVVPQCGTFEFKAHSPAHLCTAIRQVSMTTTELSEETKIKRIAMRCKNKEQFMFELRQVHRGCGADCQHIQSYLNFF